jgi:hypothetical protein
MLNFNAPRGNCRDGKEVPHHGRNLLHQHAYVHYQVLGLCTQVQLPQRCQTQWRVPLDLPQSKQSSTSRAQPTAYFAPPLTPQHTTITARAKLKDFTRNSSLSKPYYTLLTISLLMLILLLQQMLMCLLYSKNIAFHFIDGIYLGQEESYTKLRRCIFQKITLVLEL